MNVIYAPDHLLSTLVARNTPLLTHHDFDSSFLHFAIGDLVYFFSWDAPAHFEKMATASVQETFKGLEQ